MRIIYSSDLVGTIQQFITKQACAFSKIHDEIIKEYSSLVKIVREATLPEEYRDSSISLMHYFSTILKYKKIGEGASLSIENNDNGIKIVLTCLAEDQDKVLNTFYDYGMVLSGHKNIESFLQDPYQIMNLKHKLSIAELELRHSQERLNYERNSFSERINSLEKTVESYNGILGNAMTYDVNMRKDFSNLIKYQTRSSSSNIDKLLDTLANSIEKKDEVKTVEALCKIKKDDTSVFKELNEIFIKGAMSGTAGNILYQWVLPFISSLPK